MRPSATFVPVPSEAPSMTTPAELRRSMIVESGKHEEAARKEYHKALRSLNDCDPLSIGYEECQSRLRSASENLLMWRESHRQALAGVDHTSA